MKRLALVGLLWLGMGGVAQGYSHPTALITTLPTQHPYYIWVAEAKVPTPERLRIVETPCPFNLSFTCTDGETIWFGAEGKSARHLFLHELGHVFAMQYDLPVGQVSDLPGERFADSYALCATSWTRNATYGRRHRWIESPTALTLRVGTLQSTCQMIRSTL